MKCIIDGCEKVSAYSTGVCPMHYQRIKTHGDPSIVKKASIKVTPLIDRVLRNTIPVPESGCLLWLGTCSNGFHGMVWDNEHKQNRGTHRVVWEYWNGPIPDGLCVLHKCDVGVCCNINHLFIGTQRENVADKVKKERQARGETAWKAILTEQQVMEIRKRHEIAKLIAPIYGVSVSTIHAVRSRQNWKHIA